LSAPPHTEAAGELARFAAIARVAAAKGWSEARSLREALEELGPTFVKFGQMLSQRDDVVSAELATELRSLQDRAAPFPGTAARAIVEAETARGVGELFAEFEDAPLAAASVAQVHRALRRDGTRVIVKVQRPGIGETIEGDIAVLRRLARMLPAVLPSLRALNLVELVEEFAATLRLELDFEHEAHNAERFAEANRDEHDVVVPRIFWEATTRRVLTMEWGEGQRVDDAGIPPAERARLASALMRLFLTQVFEHGVFHGDPHPGNILRLADGRLWFHDFGALGELSPRVQESLRQLFLAVIARDAAWVASAYLGMGGAMRELDRAGFTRDLAASLERYYRQSGAGHRSFGAIIEEFIGLGRRYHIRLLRETALLMRAFSELESLVRRLDPQFGSLGAFRGYSARLLKHAFMPQLGAAQVAQAYRLASAARAAAGELPIALHRLMGRLERGDALFDIRHQSGGSIERHLLHASNRLAFALIVAATVVGSAILIAADAGPHWRGLPLLGVFGFVVAGVLGLAWAGLALKSGKL
jgi:ubiquinone biosynthesis protein